MSKNNLTFGYVLFVGIPLLILIGTLRAGADLSAPSAVSGDWTVEPAPNKCAEPLANASQPALSIYQTGSNLLIAFNDPRKTTLAGKLEDGSVTAVSATIGGHALRLEAAVSGKPGHRSLQGRLSFDGSNACAPVPFRAVKSGK
jgi:hypothetical protein